MKRIKILENATECVTKSRATTHGDAERNFSDIADVWSLRLGVMIFPHQVALMMIDLKIVRAWYNEKNLDNWIDIAGYAACGGEISSEPENHPL